MCDCPEPTTGAHCETLTCTHCDVIDDLLIVVISNESVTYDTAKQHCINMGYTLHMPKTQAIFNVTQHLLLQMPNQDPTLAYWIGLASPDHTLSWIWVDGTPLDNSTASWYPGRPENPNGRGTDNCAEMAAGGYKYHWDNDPCTESYPYVCEKHLTSTASDG